MSILKKSVERVSKVIIDQPEHQDFSCSQMKAQCLPQKDRLRLMLREVSYFVFPNYYPKLTHIDLKDRLEDLGKNLCQQIHCGLCFDCRAQKMANAAPLAQDQVNCAERSERIAADFIDFLPDLRKILQAAADACYLGDPAATSIDEVIFTYPGLVAMLHHRVAHFLHIHHVPIIPRFISEICHSKTGIDIHPGASINPGLFIDHGTGIVIGETAVIGNGVKLYQGVTLGAKSFPLDEHGNPIKGIARHPILHDRVTIYAGATILGRITLGEGCVIGGNLWVTDDVPPGVMLSQRYKE